MCLENRRITREQEDDTPLLQPFLQPRLALPERNLFGMREGVGLPRSWDQEHLPLQGAATDLRGERRPLVRNNGHVATLSGAF